MTLMILSFILSSLFSFCTTTKLFNSNTCCGCSLIRATTVEVSHYPNTAQPVPLGPAILKQHLAHVFSNFVDMALESARLFSRGFSQGVCFGGSEDFQQLVAVSWWFKNAACLQRRDRKTSEAKSTSFHHYIRGHGITALARLSCPRSRRRRGHYWKEELVLYNSGQCARQRLMIE
ncbi:hypothetical protein B0I37DRAFT_52475 [Chaetomium sp. MPI-CAGE-AT-0009]|nr:hypothetical protein B0I37DRAFT_52475 [Chaetomium sp. MPI-CAGE-AT-0009]